MDILVVVNQMIQLFLMIGAGFLLARCSVMDEEFSRKLTRFVLNVTMPCMIVASVSSGGLGQELSVRDMAAALVLLVLVLPAAAFLLVQLPPFRKGKGLYLFMIMFPNVGFMGFPVIRSVFGEGAVLDTAVINMFFNLSLFTLGIWAMNYGSGHHAAVRLRSLISPGVIASLAALLLYIWKLSLPDVIESPLSSVGAMTTPLAMMVIGADLSAYRLKEVLLDWKVYLFVLLIDVVLPALFYPLLSTVVRDPVIRGIALVILAMPVANGAVLFAKTYDQDTFLAAKTVFLSTMCAIVTIPFMVYLFLVK